MAADEEMLFRKAISDGDKGFEEEVKQLLDGTEVELDTEEFDVSKRYVNSETACAVLIHEDGPAGVVQTRNGTSKVQILQTGPTAGKGHRIVILNEGQTCLFYGRPSVRCFRLRNS